MAILILGLNQSLSHCVQRHAPVHHHIVIVIVMVSVVVNHSDTDGDSHSD